MSSCTTKRSREESSIASAPDDRAVVARRPSWITREDEEKFEKDYAKMFSDEPDSTSTAQDASNPTEVVDDDSPVHVERMTAFSTEIFGDDDPDTTSALESVTATQTSSAELLRRCEEEIAAGESDNVFGEARINVLNCDAELIQHTDGTCELVQKYTDSTYIRYDPKIKTWMRTDSKVQKSKSVSIMVSAADISTMVNYVHDLFVPGTMVKVKGSTATTASGEVLKVTALGQVRGCYGAMLLPECVSNLTSPAHIQRDAQWPGQFGFVSTLVTGQQNQLYDALELRQYFYQTLDPSEQEHAPYQVLVTAENADGKLYLMPDSWLHKQPHLLKKGELDPHAFVGRDDRHPNNRWLPEGVNAVEDGSISSLVVSFGQEAILERIASGPSLASGVRCSGYSA